MSDLFLLLENEFYVLRKHIYYIYATERSERSIYTEIPLLILTRKITAEDDGRFCIFFHLSNNHETLYWLFTETLDVFIQMNEALTNHMIKGSSDYLYSIQDRNYDQHYAEQRDLIDACVTEYDEFNSYDKEIQTYIK